MDFKILTVFSIFLLFIIVFAGSRLTTLSIAKDVDDKIVVNLDTSALNEWTFLSNTGKEEWQADKIYVSENSYYGNNSMAFKFISGSYGTYYIESKPIEVKPSIKYNLLIPIKPEIYHVYGIYGFFIDIVYYDFSRNYLYDEIVFLNKTNLWSGVGNTKKPKSFEWTDSNGWKLLDIEIDTPTNAKQLSIIMGLDSDYFGEVFVDDISIREN